VLLKKIQHRKSKMYRNVVLFHSLVFPFTLVAFGQLGLRSDSSFEGRYRDQVHQANGIKIGEVTSDSAIVWTRLTRSAERNTTGQPFPPNNDRKRRSRKYDELDSMEGAVPGVAGEIRLRYWPKETPSAEQTTGWKSVDVDRDFTRQFQLQDLKAGIRYRLTAEARPDAKAPVTSQVTGSFLTAPQADSPFPVRFAVVTGQEYTRRDDLSNGHQIYPRMQALGVDFFVHTGDIEYYDKAKPFADTVELARFKWNRIYAMPFQREFHNYTTSYFMKDDHDTLKNDCWPGQTYGDLTWDQGVQLFTEQVPMGKSTYRTVRWGKDLQVWLVEGRDFRSPNPEPDGPEKTIWGSEQKKWFFDTVQESDATFRILISPTPIVGPDRGNKNDNHANRGFSHEGNEIRDFIGQTTKHVCHLWRSTLAIRLGRRTYRRSRIFLRSHHR
jgi:alkaline phosphatase D